MEKKKRPNSNQLGITNFFSKILKKSAENFDEYKTIAENSHEGMQKIKVQNLEKGAIDQQNFLEKGWGDIFQSWVWPRKIMFRHP